MKAEGCLEMPDDSKFTSINGTLGNRCRERIIRAQQRRAQEQIEGKAKKERVILFIEKYSLLKYSISVITIQDLTRSMSIF